VPASDPALLAEAIGDYYRIPGLAEHHGARARRRVLTEFSLMAMADAYLAVYDRAGPATSDERIAMCAIAGIFDLHQPSDIDPALLQRMTDLQAHRGPDGGGTYREPGLGLGHRRLSIIDIGGGQQPLCSTKITAWWWSTTVKSTTSPR
jgi:hypothetical protein